MKTIAFLNIKGGVGKSTSVTTLGHILASIYNKRVLLVDLDAQSNTTAMFSNTNYYERLRDKINGNIHLLEHSVSNLLIDKNIDVHKCIKHTEYKGLDIIESDLQLTEIEERLKADVATPQQFRLKRHLVKVEEEYDFCLLDCSPSVGIVNINGLAMSDEVYIPTRTDGFSLEGVAYAKSLVETVSDYNVTLKIAGCFFTQWENFNCPKTAYELLDELMPNLLLPIKINKSKFLSENTLLQKPLLVIDGGKNKSKATINYLRLAKYIVAPNKRTALKEILKEMQEDEQKNELD